MTYAGLGDWGLGVYAMSQMRTLLYAEFGRSNVVVGLSGQLEPTSADCD